MVVWDFDLGKPDYRSGDGAAKSSIIETPVFRSASGLREIQAHPYWKQIVKLVQEHLRQKPHLQLGQLSDSQVLEMLSTSDDLAGKKITEIFPTASGRENDSLNRARQFLQRLMQVFQQRRGVVTRKPQISTRPQDHQFAETPDFANSHASR